MMGYGLTDETAIEADVKILTDTYQSLTGGRGGNALARRMN
jgi:hypothetical protein